MRALLLSLATWFPQFRRRYATPPRILILIEFLIFDAVRMAAFLADTATVHALRHSLGLYGAGAVAYGVAATVTWIALDLPRQGREGQPTANGHTFRWSIWRASC